jgi:pimeloyl-ACP methyl ester carboxylesterase
MRRRILIWLLLVIAVAAIAFLLGPRVAADTTVSFDAAAIGNDPQAYLAKEESKVPGIRPGLQKEIIWADPATRARTPLSLVYIHGFSASKGELRPLPDEIADALGANLFFTRLTGHGQDGAAMATATVNAWINDYAEAMAVGRAIGDKVVVVATSTGASLATWAATQPALSKDVATLVLISPNFGVRAAGAQMLTWPWGGLIADTIVGKEYSFKPLNPLHETLWTSRYPTSAVLTMAALVALARASAVETVGIPALFIFGDDDKIVRQDLTREIAARWGARHELVVVERSDDPSNHVIAGDALSPSTTRALAQRATAWINAVVP